MHKSQVFLLGQRQRMGACLVQCVTMQHHLGSETPGALDLDARREAGHHDDGTQAQPLRVIGHALSMVARTHCHHTTRFGGELRQLVASPTFLERCSELQVFKFEIHLRARDSRQGSRHHTRRVQDVALQPGGGLLDIVEVNHGSHYVNFCAAGGLSALGAKKITLQRRGSKYFGARSSIPAQSALW